jgi:hypothetical protein
LEVLNLQQPDSFFPGLLLWKLGGHPAEWS